MKIFNLTEEALSQRCWSQYLGNYTDFTDDIQYIYTYVIYIMYIQTNKILPPPISLMTIHILKKKRILSKS